MNPIATDNGRFKDGNPATGEYGTVVTAEHMNNVQDAVRTNQGEILTVLKEADIEPNETDETQLWQALQVLSGQVESIEALRQFEPIRDRQVVYVRAYYANSAEGGGYFIADLSDKITADNSGTVIVTTGGKRWIRVVSTCITPFEFGAKADFNHDDSDALQAAINYAQQTGIELRQPTGIYVLRKGLNITKPIKWTGDGVNQGYNLSRTESFKLNGTVNLFVDTGNKDKTALGCTDGRANGGLINNAASADFGAIDSQFMLSNYYNNDANPETGAAATPRKFSTGIYVAYGVEGCVFRDFSVILGFNGPSIDGYINKTLTLADDWDVGIYLDNSRKNILENIQVMGYWRLNGLLIRSGVLNFEEQDNNRLYAGAEENKIYNCIFQGWRSVAFRSVDMFRVMEVTPEYIDVPWADNHPFDIKHGVRKGEFTTVFIGVLSAKKVNDRLRFYTNESQVGRVVVGDSLSPNFVGNGVSGTVLRDCRLHGMWHTSERRISDPAIQGSMPPSACLEVSGTRIRGIRYEGSKCQTVDDIGLFLHQCIDFYIGSGARFEGSSPSTGAGGIRNIATNLKDSDICVRPTYRIHLGDMEQPAADFTPLFGSRPSKFRSDGYFKPDGGAVHYAQGGLMIGGDHSSHHLKSYQEAGYTMGFFIENKGDLRNTIAKRYGRQQRIGDAIHINSTFTFKPTFTTASGRIYFMLPTPATAKADYKTAFAVACQGISLADGYSQIMGVIESGSQHIYLYAFGGDKKPLPIDVSHLQSGRFVEVTFDMAYQIDL